MRKFGKFVFLFMLGAARLVADDAVVLPKVEKLGVDSPISFKVSGIKPGLYEGRLEGVEKPLKVQVGLGPAGADLAAVIVPAGAEISGKTLPLKALASTQTGVSVSEGGEGLQVDVAGKPFFTALAQSGNKPIIYPIFGPGGQMMTRSFPIKDVAGEDRDHPHQRSMWMTFGKVNDLDFWASDPINGDKPHFGRIVPKAVNIESGPVAGSIVSNKDWTDRDGKLVMQEKNTIIIYQLNDQRILDAHFVFTAPDSAPVVFGDTKEGMFGLRVPSVLDTKAKKGGKIVNSNNIDDDAAWGKSAAWVDYSGLIDGQTVGVAILNHPSSFRYPTHWHVRNYGLFAANPFGLKDFGTSKSGEFKLEAGKSIEFSYRVIFHNGRHTDAKIADAFKAYAASGK
jgi:hypothetical protein